MSQEDLSSGPVDEPPKSSAWHPSEAVADVSRLLIGTACEVLGGVARASAEAFQTVDSHVSASKPNLIEGILRGNARFLEEISHTMNTVAERFRRQDVASNDQSVASSSTNTAPHHPSV
ncbi:MAG TPA: hypothetical protein VE178_10450 [Silvibacterium sp.]|jgi:hypothetical protein|nr:hypothetical protein [Silvibacterium sp.]